MLRLEPVVQSTVDKLVTRLENIKGSSTVVNVIDMFTAFTADVIGQYSFARPYGYMDQPTFAPSWQQLMMGVSEGSHFTKQFSWFVSLMQRIPPRLVEIFAPKILPLIEQRTVIKPCFP